MGNIMKWFTKLDTPEQYLVVVTVYVFIVAVSMIIAIKILL
jgi:hypothetical protein